MKTWRFYSCEEGVPGRAYKRAVFEISPAISDYNYYYFTLDSDGSTLIESRLARH